VRDDPLYEQREASHLPLQGLVATVRPERAATEVRLDLQEHLAAVTVWLTERLGLTSQPTRRVRRGAIETVKQPSPSTNPEMYDGRSVEHSHREPAYCPGHRFATTES